LAAQIFVDTRGSCRYWAQQRDEGRQSAMFRDRIGAKHFYPIVDKYDLEIFNTAGDGYLLGRIKLNDEKKEKTMKDAVLCAMELVARFDEAKEVHELKGPESCGVGIAYGEFVTRFVPIFIKTDSSWAPTVDSDAVNRAFFCEQSNKDFNSAMTIAEEVYHGLKNEKLKKIFSCKYVNFKHEDFSRDVFCASLDVVKKFYEEHKENWIAK